MNRSNGQLFGLVVGATYVVVAIAGFFVAQDVTGGSPDDKLVLFPINHLHNVVHLAVGALLVAGSRTRQSAKAVNTLVGAVYTLVALLGFTGAAFMQTLLNIHGPGSADNFLHLVSGLAALAAGAGLLDRRRTAVG